MKAIGLINSALIIAIIMMIAIPILPGYFYIICGIIFFLKKVKVKKFNLILLLYLLFTISSIIYQMKMSPILYLFSSIFLYYSVNSWVKFKLYKPLIKTFFYVFIIFLLFSKLLSEYADGRIIGLVGDPNFYAFHFLVTAIFLYLIFEKRNYLINLLIITSVCLILVVTQSRMAFIGVVIYTLMHILRKNPRKINFIFYCILLISVFMQYFLYIITETFEVSGEVTNNLIERLLNFNDASNKARLALGYNSINYFFDRNIYDIIFGNYNLIVKINADFGNIPHSWFIQSLIINGLINTIFYLYLIILSWNKMSEKIRPYFATLILMTSILSLAPLFFSLILTAILQLINESSKELKLKKQAL